MAAWTRAKDSDRDATCRLLDNALADGQLSGDEHRRRVTVAVTATTLGELEPLLADLQVPDDERPVPVRRRRRRDLILVGAGVAAAIVIVAVAFSGGPDADAPSSSPSPHPNSETPVPESHAVLSTMAAPDSAPDSVPPAVVRTAPDLLTVDGLTVVVDSIRSRFGDTMGYELAITNDQAFLARPDPADDQQKMVYPYRGGWDDPSRRDRSENDDLTDVAAFDIPAAAAAVAAAPAKLNIAPADVASTYLDIDYIAEQGGLELLVKITTKSGSTGYLYLDPAATVKRVENPS
ncbi:uncharacterized protein RMCC_3588 [Mycolicibacterium canariasense]|uniref:DUF1707 domain-containing protein n=1 Tax=Mycolicibacterium canariasense TaxID=228230 RepID=A0A100WDM2_MYCCR|nr:DUF1707 domain-containing protein [Mycolicibacterium canariasense]MCV7211087.1 DUF1707 domain-containing protein [Mycolicibacterium canariasense]ORV08007.1 hypothetical protein AWB94_13510 [Mycolicibacterium canariasense]GAS96622.1 uncharacterized protein RMCC_3588 [Mycolicibacterium canariasense]